MPHIQIRNVPPAVHGTLKARAAKAGMTLSEYLLRELEEIASVPTMEEMVARIRSKKLYRSQESAANIIRRERRHQ